MTDATNTTRMAELIEAHEKASGFATQQLGNCEQAGLQHNLYVSRETRTNLK